MPTIDCKAVTLPWAAPTAVQRVFKRKKAITIASILGKGDMQDIIEDFMEKELHKATGLILVWEDDAGVYCRGNGEKLNALGMLEIAKRLILEDDT